MAMTASVGPSSARAWFDRAARGVVAVSDHIDLGGLDVPALGEWSMRDLLGHTSRAFLTIEAYLDAAPTPGAPTLTGPEDYVAAALGPAGAAGHAGAVTQRGRDAGAALGDDPIAAFAAIADRVVPLVAETPDDAVVATPFGVLTLAAYLPTRAFELTVHGLDLAAAIGVPPGPELLASTKDALLLAVAVAVTSGRGATALAALTGRADLTGAPIIG